MLRLSLKLLSLYLLFTAVFYVKVKLANFLFHLFSPCADTFVCFAIFVDFVKWKTYKLTVYDGNGRIEGIAAFIPGASPPEVKIPIHLTVPITQSFH